MELSLLLTQKIGTLFLILLVGVLVVRLKLVTAEQSRIISKLVLYTVTPCAVMRSFLIDPTQERMTGLLIAVGGSIFVHILYCAIVYLFKPALKLRSVEQASLMYVNAGNLIIPLVDSVLGPEWVFYTSAFMLVQTFLLWTHGYALVSEQGKIAPRQILSNVNIYAILIGLVLFFTGLRLPTVVDEAVSSLGSMVGPINMLITGILIGSISLKKAFLSPRVYLLSGLKMIAMPVLTAVCMAILCRLFLEELLPGSKDVLLIVLLAAAAPPASTITQFAQVFGKDSVYASVLNTVSFLLCIVTMPLTVLIYQAL